jgi:mycothiol system anti-sigma-R factor
MIECREAVHRMWSYLERALDPVAMEEVEVHLDTCTKCCGELEFNKHLRSMVAERNAVPVMPAELKSRMERLLAADEPTTEQPS